VIFAVFGVNPSPRSRRVDFFALLESLDIERDPDVGPATWPIEKRNLAKMFLDDLLNDREPEASPANACCHIRLGKPFAFLGESDPGVINIDDKLLGVAAKVEVDAVARALGISRKGLYLKRQRLGI